MSWIRVALDVEPEAVDLASTALCEAGASGVEVQDHETLGDAERPLTAGLARAIAYFGGEPPEDLRTRVLEVAASLGVDVRAAEAAPFTDESWKTNWKQYFKPAKVSERVQVAPPWEVPEPPEGGVNVVIEPGLAFGTGTHATTRLSLKRIDGLLAARPVASMLDVGCGSGILSVAAALLSAQVVVDAFDIDPEAKAVSLENIARNGVEGRVRVLETTIDRIEGRYDLVVANILAHVLLFLADDLIRCTSPGGRLLLCGIGEKAVEEVLAGFSARGMRLEDREVMDGWTAMIWRHAEPS